MRQSTVLSVPGESIDTYPFAGDTAERGTSLDAEDMLHLASILVYATSQHDKNLQFDLPIIV